MVPLNMTLSKLLRQLAFRFVAHSRENEHRKSGHFVDMEPSLKYWDEYFDVSHTPDD